ncbi:hypothetical protein [uncultured Cohaesibacter sp.]|uniref:hypothetical protein n=1 Tax=uncultured Cohaesibacter sp. TaxID=1002546 RepID=UPI002930124B|nr:hypothetical protein [uncultured Cohaesibacter sp.]
MTRLNQRAVPAFATLLVLFALVIFDLGNCTALNPYAAPAALAFGSGEASNAAFCALVPPAK